MDVATLAADWYALFSRYAADLYPGRYTRDAEIDQRECMARGLTTTSKLPP